MSKQCDPSMFKIIAGQYALPTLFKISSNGQELQWTIFVVGDSFSTEEGLIGGKITRSAPTVCKPKNEGRANATTADEQAEKEAMAKWQKKLDSGYFKTVDEAKGSEFFKPMLADKFQDRLDEIEWPVYSSPKLDGIRCVARKEGLFSRNGKPIVSCPHIHKLLAPIFEEYPDVIFDGELYNHKFRDNFNKIVSLVKKTKPTEEDLKESEALVQYWIFDFCDKDRTAGGKEFAERMEICRSLLQQFHVPQNIVREVKQISCANQNTLTNKYEQYLENGFEGQMVRWGDVGYQNKRSKYLLKRKEFIDAEFEIVDIIEGEGNRAGMAGYARIRLPESVNKDIYPDGIGKSNIKGDHEYLRDLLKNKRKAIGKMGTVKFFNYTPDGAPRFPYLISVRDYE